MAEDRGAHRLRGAASLALVSLALVSFLGALPLAAAVTTVTVLQPSGGEVWSGGTAHDLVWDLTTDTNNDVDVEYVINGTPTLIEQRLFLLPGRYTTAWTVPDRDLANMTIRVCATDAVPVECDASPPFSVDGADPSLTSRSPEGGNVGPAEPIDLHFSETMNLTTVAAAFGIAPSVANLSFGKLAGSGVRVTHAPFLPGLTYDVTLSCAAVDLSEPGNAVPDCPMTWTFRTATPPVVSLLSPGAGERWTGGTAHDVRWTASDAEDPIASVQIFVESSFDGGPWTPVAGPLAGNASYPWTVPTVDVTQAAVLVRAVDTRGLEAAAASPLFAIDATPPRVAAVTPPPNSVGASWSDPLVVRFSEPVVGPLDPATFGLRDGAGRWIPGSLVWDSPSRFRFAPATPFRAFTRYDAQVNGTLRDASSPGNPLVAFAWSFATKTNNAPDVALAFSPDDVLSGGSSWTIAWSATDPDDDPALLSVFLEFSDGGPFSTVAGPLLASASYAWTVPARDAPLAVLLVRVIDSQAGEATDAVAFAIDATPPQIITASPAAGAIDVTPDAEILVGFSEPIANAGNVVGLRDVSTGTWADTSASWDDATTLRLRPANLLRELYTYEVVVNGTATDLSSPGNPLAATSWTFRVASFPPILTVLDPANGARWTAGSAQTVRVRAADARDPSVLVAADLALDGVAFAPWLAATSVANTEASLAGTAPSVDAPNAALRVCATDLAGAAACVRLSVAIDGVRPRILQSLPAPGAKQVHPGSAILLTFSESMDPATVEAAFSLNPATPLSFRWARTLVDNDTAVVDHPRFLELRTYTAFLGCPARDASAPGLPLAGACPVTWTFTTAAAPEIRLLTPVGGERLTGGVPQPIRWVAAEEEGLVRVSVDLSLDGGATFPVHFASWEPFAVGDVRTERTFPRSDTPAAVLRVTAVDSLGLTATTTSGPFAIDAAAPTLLAATPAQGASDVSPFADLILVFSEPMDPATAYALTVTPPLRDAVVTWSATNAPFDTLRIGHSAVRLGTTVTIALDGMRDASRPGSPIAANVVFTIRPDRERPTATLVIDAEATAGDVVVLDASGSSDNDEIVEYAWTVRDASGRPVGRFRGERVEYRTARPGAFNVTVAVIDASGNRGEATAAFRVHALGTTVEAALPPAIPAIGWLALGGGGATAYGLTDRGRSFLTRTLLLPLYVRMNPEKIRNQETRGMIRGYVRVHPGDTYTDIKRNLGLANGEAAYHLQVLEREGIIRSVTKGARHIYYPAGMPIPENGGGLHEIQRRILEHVEGAPGMLIRDLASLLGISSQLALYHVRKLGEEGLVKSERQGLKFRVFPTTPEERETFRLRTEA